ncbi:purine-nucleoside phosphorylase [Bullifex porci]|uniref:purine-nucleoside phosphorylase n=1 Tax=Bullifex porci TaxID=2606638 RepID=UPI0023F17F00|nr:purine-nucleoside phosphorylase [Bullifex porci]MDD7589453.1 purine-nucleoside phosphorylase [Bullifex porci]
MLLDNLKESAAYIKSITGDIKFDIAMVLGSGLGDMAETLGEVIYIPYSEIPHFPVSTVPGHKGRLAIGLLEGKRVVCMQGRFHYYEGWTMQQCVYPIQVFKMLGINNLMLTNAAGCVNTAWQPGDLMVINDHIKVMGDSPMRGANCDELGPRFFDMSHVYEKELQKVAHSAAAKLGFSLRDGVYMLFGGPQFETPAEVRMARLLGADAVGMSTVPEAISASQMSMKVLGISCLTNMGAGILDQTLNHEEVLETGEKVKSRFQALVREIVSTWPL